MGNVFEQTIEDTRKKHLVPWRPRAPIRIHAWNFTRKKPWCLLGQGRETNQETHIVAELPLEIQGGLLEDPSFSSI